MIFYLSGLGIDQPLVRGGQEFYLMDGVGSVLGLTNLDGMLATRYVYEPFGRTTSEGASSTNPFQFTGRENDELASLYHYRSRPYRSATGRFTRRDPAGFMPGELNPYSYVGNNPLRFTEPLGFDKQISMAGVGNAMLACAPCAAAQRAAQLAALAAALGAIAIETSKPSDGNKPNPPKVSDNPAESPEPDWQWKGSGPPESGRGNWVNEKTGEKIFHHPNSPSHGPISTTLTLVVRSGVCTLMEE